MNRLCRNLIILGLFALFTRSISAQTPSSLDAWDISRGTVVTSHSGLIPEICVPEGMFGGQAPNGLDWTYFADGQPEGFVHYIEWQTTSPITLNHVRVFAFGDDFLNNGREFDQLVIKAKSPGSAEYDLTILTYTPSHPYAFLNSVSSLVVDQAVASVSAQSFRAEFLQYTADNGWDGPRIVEIDGFSTTAPLPVNIPSTASDAWDVTQGAIVTGTSGFHPVSQGSAALFGENGQANHNGNTWTYFADGRPSDFIHYVEWQTPAPIGLERVRIYAFGDDFLNNGREFDEVTIKAKSPGSADYDITILTYTATHPYIFFDPINHLILDQAFTPVTAQHFRAEFKQYTAGFGFDGPRIVEIDGFAVQPPPPPNIPSRSDDVWDVFHGSYITSTSGFHPVSEDSAALFGELGQNNGDGSTWTYFADGQPEGFVHWVEWETSGYVTLEQIRLYAFGDSSLNNGREFDHVTIKAKSEGSSEYDVIVADYTPTHPYTFIDPVNFLILDQPITPLRARSFRAEFLQYTAGLGLDGPRIVEIDGLGVPPPPPPVIVSHPQGAIVNYDSPVRLKVDAIGTGTLSYQWLKDGIVIPGATSSTLVIDGVTHSEVGSYNVAITDDYGTTRSSAADIGLELNNMLPSTFDLWDINGRGMSITNSSAYHPTGNPGGMFGGGEPALDTHVTYFGDNQPPGTVHFVEWNLVKPARVKTIRLFAHGDGPGLADSREFTRMNIWAKSPGSAEFDIFVGSFIPTHPYTFLDHTTAAVLDLEFDAIRAASFRVEFEQFTAGFGYDGPRIVELDAFTSRPQVIPAVIVGPESQTVIAGSPGSLNVLARGGNLQYKWKLNGRILKDQRSSTLVIPNAELINQGEYTVEISNDLGTVTTAPASLIVQ